MEAEAEGRIETRKLFWLAQEGKYGNSIYYTPFWSSLLLVGSGSCSFWNYLIRKVLKNKKYINVF